MCFHNVLYDQNGQQIEIDVSSRQTDHCKLFISILIQIQLIKLHIPLRITTGIKSTQSCYLLQSSAHTVVVVF